MNDVSDGAVVARPSGASAQALIAREAQDVLVHMRCAREYPRDVVQARERVLNAFQRPGLCEKALYSYSKGGSDVQGLSIRAAEELARQWGNIRCGVVELSRAGGVSEVLTFAQDLETGFSDEKRFHVRHVRDTRSGGKPLTEDREIYEHVANMAARRKRACILAVVSSDIAAEAEEQIHRTLHEKVKMTPERIKSMLSMFEKYNVTTAAIEKRIQRRIDAMLPQQFLSLGRIYTSLEDGMSEPGDWFEIAAPSAEAGGPPPGSDRPGAQPDKSAESRTGQLKKQMRRQVGGGAKPDTTERGAVMNPPESAAEGSEARNRDTPQRQGASPAPQKEAGVQAAPPASSAPEREPGSDDDAGEAIPHFSEETALEAIAAVTNLGQFKDITNQIGDDFNDTEREVPPSVVDASEKRQAEICVQMIKAGTTSKKLETAHDRVVASYGSNGLPDAVVAAYRKQKAAVDKAGK